MSELTLEQLGKYEVRSEIDRGSMGIVYLGHDPYVNREVALKVALADSLTDPDSGVQYRKMFKDDGQRIVFDLLKDEQCKEVLFSQRRNKGIITKEIFIQQVV